MSVVRQIEEHIERIEIENAALKQEIEQLKVRAAWDESNVAMFADQVEKLLSEKNQLKADKTALLECVKWYKRNLVSVVLQKPARECLAQIGGTQ